MIVNPRPILLGLSFFAQGLTSDMPYGGQPPVLESIEEIVGDSGWARRDPKITVFGRAIDMRLDDLANRLAELDEWMTLADLVATAEGREICQEAELILVAMNQRGFSLSST